MRILIFLFCILSFSFEAVAQRSSRGGGPGNGGFAVSEEKEEIREIVESDEFKKLLANYAEAYFSIIDVSEIKDDKIREIFEKMAKVEENGKFAIVNDIWDSDYKGKEGCFVEINLKGRKIKSPRDATTDDERGADVCFNLTSLSKLKTSDVGRARYLLKLALHEHAHHFGFKDPKNKKHAIGYVFRSPFLPFYMSLYATSGDSNEKRARCVITDVEPEDYEGPAQYFYVLVNGRSVPIVRKDGNKNIFLAAIDTALSYQMIVGCEIVAKTGRSLDPKGKKLDAGESAVLRIAKYRKKVKDKGPWFEVFLDGMRIPILARARPGESEEDRFWVRFEGAKNFAMVVKAKTGVRVYSAQHGAFILEETQAPEASDEIDDFKKKFRIKYRKEDGKVKDRRDQDRVLEKFREAFESLPPEIQKSIESRKTTISFTKRSSEAKNKPVYRHSYHGKEITLSYWPGVEADFILYLLGLYAPYVNSSAPGAKDLGNAFDQTITQMRVRVEFPRYDQSLETTDRGFFNSLGGVKSNDFSNYEKRIFQMQFLMLWNFLGLKEEFPDLFRGGEISIRSWGPRGYSKGRGKSHDIRLGADMTKTMNENHLDTRIMAYTDLMFIQVLIDKMEEFENLSPEIKTEIEAFKKEKYWLGKSIQKTKSLWERAKENEKENAERKAREAEKEKKAKAERARRLKISLRSEGFLDALPLISPVHQREEAELLRWLGQKFKHDPPASAEEKRRLGDVSRAFSQLPPPLLELVRRSHPDITVFNEEIERGVEFSPEGVILVGIADDISSKEATARIWTRTLENLLSREEFDFRLDQAFGERDFKIEKPGRFANSYISDLRNGHHLPWEKRAPFGQNLDYLEKSVVLVVQFRVLQWIAAWESEKAVIRELEFKLQYYSGIYALLYGSKVNLGIDSEPFDRKKPESIFEGKPLAKVSKGVDFAILEMFLEAARDKEQDSKTKSKIKWLIGNLQKSPDPSQDVLPYRRKLEK